MGWLQIVGVAVSLDNLFLDPDFPMKAAVAAFDGIDMAKDVSVPVDPVIDPATFLILRCFPWDERVADGAQVTMAGR